VAFEEETGQGLDEWHEARGVQPKCGVCGSADLGNYNDPLYIRIDRSNAVYPAGSFIIAHGKFCTRCGHIMFFSPVSDSVEE
jgi:hypothetical protein